eukprot:CAMPEP_0119491164 /NCGR_PEP_ID=MMETSP1344-20130328/16128_1 /TAXON_ID=236787 /ORGANISM="Florenciella parvula, Strain CCMP2471" /LENGTH=76 /DNA_ID=CAMNT_0007526399 /DNA_START=1 /DNA_END=227 /DNA_ORIENTATION=+
MPGRGRRRATSKATSRAGGGTGKCEVRKGASWRGVVMQWNDHGSEMASLDVDEWRFPTHRFQHCEAPKRGSPAHLA